MRTFCSCRTFLLVAAVIATVGARGLCQQESAAAPQTPRSQLCLAGDCQSADGGATQDGGATRTSSQKSEAPPPADNTVTLKKAFLNLPGDQKAIWTSPFRLHPRDSFWVVPLLGTTGVLIGS